MPEGSRFFTNSLIHAVEAVSLMASPQGTTVEELSRRLQINRRSVFRLIKTMEHDLSIPVVISRNVFGGHATYRLTPSFIDRISNIRLPPLTSNQAALVYMVLSLINPI
jgi:predicted DNA-binding transcriptional regulator YafY